jgi:hypothetical protein
MGKSQLLADIRALYGNNASYVLCRNDMDIRSLFRQMNFRKLVDAMKEGGTVSQKDLSEITSRIYKPLTVAEELDRAAEIVQNQLFNVFEGFIELDGDIHSLGGTEEKTFRDFAGNEYKRNVAYSVGVWSANMGNGSYTGTVSMDKAMKERSHLIINVKNFRPGGENPSDLDSILLGCEGEIRLKSQEKPEDHTQDFINAFTYLKQKAKTPDPAELGEELLLFRYLVQGLDYIPCQAADNSKSKMEDVWPSKAEEEGIGSEDDIILYRMIYPASVRVAQTMISFARALREYAKAENPKAKPTVQDSVIEAFKLIAAYSGMMQNPQRITEGYVGNPYRASCDAAKVIKARLDGKKDLIQAIGYFRGNEQPLPKSVLEECTGEFACWK